MEVVSGVLKVTNLNSKENLNFIISFILLREHCDSFLLNVYLNLFSDTYLANFMVVQSVL